MYLLACLVLLFDTLAQILRAFSRLDVASGIAGLNGLAKAWAQLPLTLLASAPVFALFLDAAGDLSGKGIQPTSGLVSVWMSLVGAGLFLLLLGRRTWSQSREGQALGFWGVGRIVGCVLACGLILISTTKQLAFVDRTAGAIGFTYFRDKVSDMICDADVLLAKLDLDAGGPVEYRCPTSFVLNRYSSAPFVPWPDYSEGTSAQLGAQLKEMIESAEHLPKESAK